MYQGGVIKERLLKNNMSANSNQSHAHFNLWTFLTVLTYGLGQQQIQKN